MAFKPYMMKDVDLILGDEATGPNFKCQVKKVTLNPEVNIQKVKTACPDGQYSAAGDPEWTLEIGYLYGSDNGAGAAAPILSDYLLDNVGTDVPFLFRPTSGGPGYSGTVTLVPGAIGGEQGNFSEQTVNLPVQGQPAKVAAA